MAIEIDAEDRITPELRELWLDLLPAERWAFFSHPDWCESVWNHFGPVLKLRILVARDDGKPVGLLPVWSRRMNRFGLFLPVAELFGSRRGDYGGPVVRMGQDPGPVLRALFDAALEQPRKWGTLIWPNMPGDAGFTDLLDDHLRSRGMDFVREDRQGWLIPIDGTYDEIAAGWSKKFRGNMNRYPRRIEEDLGPLELEVLDTEERALEALPGYFEMHNRRWIESGSPGTFTDPNMRAFFTDLVHRLSGGPLHFSVLRAGGKPVAYHFGFFWGDHLLVYKSTFDMDQSGAGKVIYRSLIEEGVRCGWKGMDLLQGDYTYKERMASTRTATTSFIVRTGAIAPGHFWITRARPAIQERMGGTIYKTRGFLDRLKQRITG